MRTRAFISKKWLNTIIITWLIAGSLDILLAFMNAWWSAGVTPLGVLRFVASGLISEMAFKGSMWVIAVGLIIHYLIAFCWTFLFFWWYPTIRKVISVWLWQAISYGLIIWLVMNFLVLPLTDVSASKFQWWPAVKGAVILMVAIGLPVAINAGRYDRSRYRVYRRRRHIKDVKN